MVSAAFALTAITAGATNFYWTGAAGDGEYTTAGNWVTGSATSTTVPAACPQSNTYSDRVYFTDASNPSTKSVHLSDNKTICGATVSGSGWTFSGSRLSFGYGNLTVQSGADLVANNELGISQGDAVFDINGSATIAGVCVNSCNMEFRGSGTIYIGYLFGYLASQVNTLASGTTLRIGNSKLYSKGTTGSHYLLKSETTRLQYKGTLAAAQNLVGVSGSQKGGVIAGSGIAEGYELAVRELSGDDAGYVEFYFRQTAAPVISSASAAVSETGELVATVNLSQGVEGTVVTAVATDGAGNEVETECQSTVTVGEDVSFALSGLTAGETYTIKLVASNSSGTSESAVTGSFYNGVPSLAKVSDANEYGLVAGSFTVSRALSSTLPLVVNLSYSSPDGAVGGQTYVVPASSVTIPAGELSASVAVVPLTDPAVAADSTLVVSLAAGNYSVVSAQSAEVAIRNIAIPEGVAAWAATQGSDGLASNPQNWYGGALPSEGDDILLTDAMSSIDMIWDGEASGMPSYVGNWTQQGYSGTVTVRTAYNGAFSVLDVRGDFFMDGGAITHPANSNAQTYRLNVAVGGDLTIGSAATVTAYRKGYAANNYPAGGAIGLHGGGRGNSAAVCGSVTMPESIGAGGDSFPGGGAVKFVVAGDATVDGRITVGAGENESYWGAMLCGAPGSVFISAKSLSGAGYIDASAPLANGSAGNCPSGGRIGIVLTEATSLGLPIANIAAKGTLARESSSTGAGTVFVKTANQAYGTLYVKNVFRDVNGTYGIMLPKPNGTTIIPPGETWTFDGIVFGGAGILSIPEGATLQLPGGLASVTGTSLTSGILYRGGTIDFGNEASHTMGGSWVFHAAAPFTFSGNVTVGTGAALGVLRLYYTTADYLVSDIRVAGDLTVASGGFLYASGAGLAHGMGGNLLGARFSFGGMPGVFAATGNLAGRVYGSILNPLSPGSHGYENDSAAQYPGGGALKVTVSGALLLDGRAVAESCLNDGTYNPGGTGGSINLAAASISGAGSISANGHSPEQNASKVTEASQLGNSGVISCGGGGRISLRLTGEGETVPATMLSRITAYGGAYTRADHRSGTATNTMCSAGTIYVQQGGVAEGAGTIYVNNGSRDYNTACVTPFPSLAHGGESDVLRNAELDVSGLSAVALTTNVRIRAASVAAGSRIDLEGRTLFVESLSLGGEKVSAGTYAASELGSCVCDSSEGEIGSVVIVSGFVIIVR